MPNTDLKKTLTDAGYIAIGLGVMGFQQAQTRAREARLKAENARSCLRRTASDTQSKVQETGRTAQSKVQETSRAARDRAETQVRGTVTRVRIIRGRVTDRVEPTVGKVQAQL